MKLVSVIVPNYNYARYLRARMDSILGQDYQNLELIVLDDCSTDDSMEVIETYRTDSRVHLIEQNQTNTGCPFAQWKKGIQLAQGDYIWIAESDDCCQPNLVSSLVKMLEENPQASLAFADSDWVDEQGQSLPKVRTGRWSRDFVMDGQQFALRHLLGYSYICNASAVVMRQKAAQNVSDRCLQYRYSGDRQFWIEMAMQGDVCYLAQRLNQFRQHTNKVSNIGAQQGRNIVEDHAIYRYATEQLHPTRWERQLACGYHLRAMQVPELSPEGRRIARQVWAEEKDANGLSLLIYYLNRLVARFE